MNKNKRDKLLTEKLGECSHNNIKKENIKDPNHEYGGYKTNKCQNCGEDNSFGDPSKFDFSEWDSFGMLWEYATKQEWWNDFLVKRHLAYEQSERIMRYGSNFKNIINPDRFADALYNYLKNK